jgi:hypothetical protein
MNELVNRNDDGWIKTTCPGCAKNTENHLENRRTELVELFQKVKEPPVTDVDEIKDILAEMKKNKMKNK